MARFLGYLFMGGASDRAAALARDLDARRRQAELDGALAKQAGRRRPRIVCSACGGHGRVAQCRLEAGCWCRLRQWECPEASFTARHCPQCGGAGTVDE